VAKHMAPGVPRYGRRSRRWVRDRARRAGPGKVLIRAIGIKEQNRLQIGRKELEL